MLAHQSITPQTRPLATAIPAANAGLWASQHYHDACENHWQPYAIDMQEDIETWQTPHALTHDERLMIKRNLGLFASADSLLTNNLVLALYKRIPITECQQYLLHQSFAQSQHHHAYQYMLQSFALEEVEVFTHYRQIPAVHAKSLWSLAHIQPLASPQNIEKTQYDQPFLQHIIAFYLIFEGLYFHVGFIQMLALGRQNKMLGLATQFRHIMRDKLQHKLFGIDLINQIKQENPKLWTPDFKSNIITLLQQAMALEKQHATDTMTKGIVGLNTDLFTNYLEFVINQHCQYLGLPKQFTHTTNPFPWLEASNFTAFFTPLHDKHQ